MTDTPSLNQMMQQLQRAQVEMNVVREKLKTEFVVAESADGAVSTKMSGDSQLIEVKLDPEKVQAGELAALEKSIVEAVNEVMRAAAELTNRRIGTIADGLGLSDAPSSPGPGGPGPFSPGSAGPGPFSSGSSDPGSSGSKFQ